MVAVTFTAIYPIGLVFGYFINPHIKTWPVPLRALLLPIVAPILLTYVLMPWLTQKVFRYWLYKQ